MATTYYVDDGGSATDPFDTYAKAAQTLAALIAAKGPFAVDDEIHIGHDHAESTAAPTFAFANGTEAQPIRIISTNTTSDNYQAGATIDESGAGDISISTGNSVWYGVTFTPGDDLRFSTSNTIHKFYDCTIDAADRPVLFDSSEQTVEFHDCILTSADAANPNMLIGSEAFLFMRGCTVTMGSAGSGEAIISFLSPSDGTTVTFEDCDFSGSTSDMVLASLSSSNNVVLIFRRCKLPSSYVMPTAVAGNHKVRVESCSGGTDTVPFLGITEWLDIIGSTKAVVAQNRTGGASDGVNDYSWEMNPNANVSFFSPLESLPIVYWAEEGSQTVTIHIANDADLDTDQCWMVVEHPDTATPANPDHVVLSNTKPDPLVTGNAIARDAGSVWDGAGTGTDGSTGQQKLVSDAFDPTEAGPVIIRVYLATDDTMYVDPQPQIA